MSLLQRTKSDLEAMGRGALKLRGQHFLVDENVLDRIVEASGVKNRDRVLEIGPGLGFLTEKLLALGCEVAAIELDEGFADHLEHHFGNRVRIVRGDALRQDFQKLFSGKAFHLVANIPYNISAKLLEKLVEQSDCVSSATLLVQKEVAERVAAKAGSMNMLALIVQSAYESHIAFTVPAGVFFPPPKVQSAVLQLTRRASGKGDMAWLRIAKKAFMSPRKKISTTLGWERNVFKVAGLTGDERPAELGMDQWHKLAVL